MGDALAADRYLRLAAVRSPDDSRIYTLLALLRVTDDDHSSELDSVRTLDFAIKLGLDNASLLRELGNAYFQLERHAVAEALLRRAVAAEPKTGAYAHAIKRLVDIIAVQNMYARPK